MSQSSAAHVQAAANLAAAISAQLAAKPNQVMTMGSVADLLGSIMQSMGPAAAVLVPGVPEIGLVVALASVALRAFHAATTTGEGLTPEQRAQLVSVDDAAIAADLAAHPATA